MTNDKNQIPLECPSTQQEKKIDPIVDVVEKELNPPATKEVESIISKSPQE